MRINRESIRFKGIKNPKKHVLFLYGRLNSVESAKAYCELHKCYLSASNIKEKGCNFKKCKYRKEVENGIIV